MATTKKTDSGKPAAKQSAARKPAAKKAAAKKAATKKPVAKKAAETEAVKPAKRVSAAKTKAKAERKAPEKVPGRKERRGIVVSDAMDKTIVVRIDVAQKHERYGKVVRRSSKLHAHDEQNAAGVGDLVRIVETRPLSASKRWRLLEILEKAK
jgi:small subunit ribosomal protein S17